MCRADAVRLDEIDAAGRARLEKAEELLARRQWDEAVEILRQTTDIAGDKLIATAPGQYIPVESWCRHRLIALPPEGLKIYRGLVDATAGDIYRRGIAQRDERLLLAVAERHRASMFGDAALRALGEIEFERGNFTAARRYWQRILSDDGSKGLPPQLENLLVESRKWVIADTDWPTFAGNPRRNGIAPPPPKTLGKVAWRLPLDCPRIYPVVVGGLAFLCNPREVLAVRLDNGAAAWGNSPVIFRTQYADAERMLPPSDASFAAPQTLTVFDERLFTRLGTAAEGELVALDLTAEGRLLWSRPAEDGWTWEGCPVADHRGVYASMRSREPRPRAAVVCLDAQSGRLRWRRIVCAAETLDREKLPPAADNLLALDEGMIYYDTMLGAAAAMRTIDGRVEWISVCPSVESHGPHPNPLPKGEGTEQNGPHPNPLPKGEGTEQVSPLPLAGEGPGVRAAGRREAHACLTADDVMYFAPAGRPGVLALDMTDGKLLWQTSDKITEAVELLGATDEWLIAAGRKSYWIALKGDRRGQVVQERPVNAEQSSLGRGLLAGNCVLRPIRDKLYVFDRRTAAAQQVFDLAALGATGGNLVLAGNRLLIASDKELVAVEIMGEQSK